LFVCAVKATLAVIDARGQERGTPQGGEAQESQGAVTRRNLLADTPTGRGMKPLKRSR
jgi:hypothetical protein